MNVSKLLEWAASENTVLCLTKSFFFFMDSVKVLISYLHYKQSNLQACYAGSFIFCDPTIENNESVLCGLIYLCI